MELAALALVNVLSALAMYLFFSMRFTRAVEEQRKLPLTRELKDNIRLAIEFINSSVDLMDQKSRTFYQMVRRAEELTARLEELSAVERESATAPKKRRSRKTEVAEQGALLAAPTAGTEAREAAGSDSRPPTGKKATIAATLAAPQPPSAPAARIAARPASGERAGYAGAHVGPDESYDVERALDRLGADRLDITPAAPSVDAAFRSGELSRPADRFAEAQPGDVLSGFLGRIGGAVRRTLGLESALTGLNYEEVVRAARAAREPGPASASESQVPGAIVERPRFVIPEAPPLEARPPRRAAAEPQPRDLLPRFDRFENGGPAFSAEPEGLYGPQRTRAAARATRGLENDDASDPLLDALETALQRGELRNFVLSQRSQRTQVLRALLSYGYRPEEISAETGVGLAEIELAAALPAGGRRPRKQRLLDPDR
jgi:hypothetical protein